MILNPLNRVVVWFQSIHWSRTDKAAAAALGAFLVLAMTCAGGVAIGDALGTNSVATTSLSAAHASTPRPTATLPVTATPRPTPTPHATATPHPPVTSSPPDVLLLGGNISAFLSIYGPATDQSNLQNGDYHFREYPGSPEDYLIVDTGLIMGDSTTAQTVASILVQSSPTQQWTLTQAEEQCAQFLPADAQRIKTYAPPVNGQPGDLDIVYRSATLAREFPAKDFTDVNQNPTLDGSFDVSYLSGAPDYPDQYGSCSIIIGEQQTQN